MGFFKDLFKVATFRKNPFSFAYNTAKNVFGVGKVDGIPTPQQGRQTGQSEYARDEARYPGTTPWERLGSGSPMGQIASAGIQAKNQHKLQLKQLAVQKVIADKQAKAQVIGATAPHGQNAQQTSLDLLKGKKYQSTTPMGAQQDQKDLQTRQKEAEIHRNKYGQLAPLATIGKKLEKTSRKAIDHYYKKRNAKKLKELKEGKKKKRRIHVSTPYFTIKKP